MSCMRHPSATMMRRPLRDFLFRHLPAILCRRPHVLMLSSGSDGMGRRMSRASGYGSHREAVIAPSATKRAPWSQSHDGDVLAKRWAAKQIRLPVAASSRIGAGGDGESGRCSREICAAKAKASKSSSLIRKARRVVTSHQMVGGGGGDGAGRSLGCFVNRVRFQPSGEGRRHLRRLA